MAVRALPDGDLRGFLSRSRRLASPLEFPLHEFFCETLRRANEFVPSMAGSVLLDDPEGKRLGEKPTLTFVATFGPVGDKVLGLQIAADQGIAGHVYVHGRSYVAADCESDPYFIRDIDMVASFDTRSILAVPIRIERSVCGVIELINRRRRQGYTSRDIRLLEIFAGYLSSAIQNAVDTQKARDLARRDDLTHLGNDRALGADLVTAVEETRRTGEPVSVIFLDVDHFKEVNDRWGHLVGSRTLREVGATLARNLPRGASAYRYGGDEFVVLLGGTDLARAMEVAGVLHAAVRARLVVPEQEDDPLVDLTGLTLSAGVASAGPADLAGAARVAASELLGAADRAMYTAKQQGRDRVIAAAAPKATAGVLRLFRP